MADQVLHFCRGVLDNATAAKPMKKPKVAPIRLRQGFPIKPHFINTWSQYGLLSRRVLLNVSTFRSRWSICQAITSMKRESSIGSGARWEHRQQDEKVNHM